MAIQDLIERLRAHSESERIGMIASHLGVVRGTSLDGTRVWAIDVVYDRDALESIINDARKLDGIVDLLVEIYEGHLEVGQEILEVAVAGETRDVVFPALISTVNRIKAEAVKKKEHKVE